MSDKRPSSTRLRRECFDRHKRVDEAGRIYLVCYLCGYRIDPAREKWEAEHTLRRSLGLEGRDDPENILPAHTACHKPKTKRDIKENSKGVRVRDKHFGIERPQGFRRPADLKYDWKRRRYVREYE